MSRATTLWRTKTDRMKSLLHVFAFHSSALRLIMLYFTGDQGLSVHWPSSRADRKLSWRSRRL